MATERIDIVIGQTGADSAGRAISGIGDSADTAAKMAAALAEEVRRLSAENDAMASGLDDNRAAVERLGEFIGGLVDGLAAEAEAHRAAGDAAQRAASQRARAADAVQALEDKYAALEQANGDEAAARRILALNAQYAQELAIVDHASATRLKITERYEREMARVREEIAQKSAAPVPTAPGPSTSPGSTNPFAWKAEAGRVREAAQFITGSLGQIASASSGAGAGLRLVSTALLGGGGVVLALEAVHTVATLATSAYENWTRETLEAARANREHAETLRLAKQRTDDFLADVRGMPESVKAYRSALRELDGEVQKHKEEIAKITEESSLWDDYEKRARKVQALWDKIVALQSQARQDAAIRSAAVEEQNRTESDKRGRKLAADIRETQRTFGNENLALAAKFSADEVRIAQEKRRALDDLEHSGTYALKEQIDARKRLIEANAAEEIRRAREARAVAQGTALRGYEGEGASPVARELLAAQTFRQQWETDFAQADRAHDDEKKRRLVELRDAYEGAHRLRLNLLDAEDKSTLAILQHQREQAEVDAAIDVSLEKGARWLTLQQLGVGGGDLEAAKRLVELEDRLAERRSELNKLQKENPDRAGEIEAARAKLERGALGQRMEAAGLGDLFAGTQPAIDAQLASFRTMFEQIDAMRAKDSAHAEMYEQMKAQVAARQDAVRLQGAQSTFATLAQMQNSSVHEIAAIGKAAAIAQATIDGVLAVQKALASAPPPWNFALAGSIAAVTGANVAQIVSTGFMDGGFTGWGRRDEPAGVVHGREFVFDADATARIGPANLEAMRRSAQAGTGPGPYVPPATAARPSMNFTVKNLAPGVEVSAPREVAPGEWEVEVRRLIAEHAPRAVAADLAYPNSPTRMTLARHTTLEAR